MPRFRIVEVRAGRYRVQMQDPKSKKWLDTFSTYGSRKLAEEARARFKQTAKEAT